MVWGGNIDKRTGKLVEWTVHDENGDEGMSNTYSGYKAVAVYRQRVKTTYNNPNGRGGYRTVRQVIRQSQKKKITSNRL